MQFDETLLLIFMLAAFLGFQPIKRISPLLHSSRISLTNAISGVAVSAITIAGKKDASTFARVLGFIATTQGIEMHRGRRLNSRIATEICG